jgi:hypothetical protein
MKSYIKIYGPPMLKALKALEKIAIDVPDVSIMSTIISEARKEAYLDDGLGVMGYFGGSDAISKERSLTIISKSAETLGEYDFYFEWSKEPKMSELNSLIEKIDNALADVGAKYTITTI